MSCRGVHCFKQQVGSHIVQSRGQLNFADLSYLSTLHQEYLDFLARKNEQEKKSTNDKAPWPWVYDGALRNQTKHL